MFYDPFIQMKLITIAQHFRPTLDIVEGCHDHDRMVVRFITCIEPNGKMLKYFLKLHLDDKYNLLVPPYEWYSLR